MLAILQVQQDRLFVRIYEDNVAGKLDDGRFAMMSKNYTEEQKNLKTEVKGLQQRIHEQEQQAENIEQFVQRVKKNGTLTELTPYALRELAKAVYVEAPNKSSGKRRQKVYIEYDLVGYIPVDELLKEEQAWPEIMPVPRNLKFTVLPAGRVVAPLARWKYKIYSSET